MHFVYFIVTDIIVRPAALNKVSFLSFMCTAIMTPIVIAFLSHDNLTFFFFFISMYLIDFTN